jgi:hypothetical protein
MTIFGRLGGTRGTGGTALIRMESTSGRPESGSESEFVPESESESESESELLLESEVPDESEPEVVL